MEQRAIDACARDYNGFDWQSLMVTAQQWRDLGYTEDQVFASFSPFSSA